MVEKNAATTVCAQGSALQVRSVLQRDKECEFGPQVPRSRVNQGSLAGFVSATT
jgi:hypothetical protein